METTNLTWKRQHYAALRLQQLITLVGQAINATNFHRRKTVLSSHTNNEAKSANWLRETYSEELLESKEELFGEKFFKSMKKHAQNKNKSLKQRLMPSTTSKPFQTSSSTSTKPVGEQKMGRKFDEPTGGKTNQP